MIRVRDDAPSANGKMRGRTRWWAVLARTSAIALLSAGCGDKTPPPSPPCEQDCRDGVALRALRETMKYAFNKTLQMKPVGMHDETTNEFIRGSARVSGDATSNAEQGTTKVNLTYVFSQAAYYQKDTEPRENFVMVVDGTITQNGTIAVQPSSPTSLIMRSDAISLVGRVYDPPIDYSVIACPVELNQNGSNVSGWLCKPERVAGFSF